MLIEELSINIRTHKNRIRRLLSNHFHQVKIEKTKTFVIKTSIRRRENFVI